MSLQYRNEVEIANKKKTLELLEELPLFSKSFFVNMENMNASTNTIKNYAYDIRLFFQFLGKQAGFKNENMRLLPVEKLDSLTKDDISEYISYLSLYEDESGRTVVNGECGRARKIASLRSFYNFYYRNEYINTNPASLLDTPKQHKKEIIRMSKNDVYELLNCIREGDEGLTEHEKLMHSKTRYRDEAILTTLLGTGMRVSECVGINLQDIDYKEGCFHIIRKGGNEDRVFFPIEVEDALNKYIEEERNFMSPTTDSDALFLSLQNKRINVRTVQVLVKKYSIRAGIGARITPHKCRSTYGTNLYAETGDIYMVADALGHSSVETTRKHYAAMSEERKRTAGQKSSSLFE